MKTKYIKMIINQALQLYALTPNRHERDKGDWRREHF